jgi:hypothetical protein
MHFDGIDGTNFEKMFVSPPHYVCLVAHTNSPLVLKRHTTLGISSHETRSSRLAANPDSTRLDAKLILPVSTLVLI